MTWLAAEFSWDAETEQAYREELEEALREAVPEV